MTLSQKVDSPCPYFPECGGCDFLDLPEEEYQKIKKGHIANLIQDIESFKNQTLIADARVQPVRSDSTKIKFKRSLDLNEFVWVGPHSRRKIILQIGVKNEIGFFAKKSKKIVEIENCYASEKIISDLILPLKSFIKSQEQNLFTQISVTLFDNVCDLVFSAKRELNFAQIQKLTNLAKEQGVNVSYKIKNHITPVFLSEKNQIFYPEFKIDLSSDVFIQATKAGLENIIKIIRKEVFVGASVVDLYSGFGAYVFAISDLAKKISAFEGSEEMVGLINKNAAANGLSKKIKAEIRDLFSDPLNKNELNNFDLAIINPPRNGASPQVSEIAKSQLKKLVYVSCNPESFRRDAKILIDSGFKISKLIALDQFYSTRHLELISIFQK
jgi:23S rRNA (uracil1939-C5)-methyltransferase